ncbi:uncharacterized protein mslnb isoform X2 [Sardina pilchardus]|uniref:uncharacterized protein mslnb isoform X2 n=1 Tax=Sardina pilchardus TaxID=27697 RepID=UPI002E107E34
MRTPYVFLLLYSALSGPGVSWVQAQNDTCNASGSLSQQQCGHGSDSTSRFLQCAGVPSGPLAGPHHVKNLVNLLDAALDVYSFMRSTLSQGPVLEVSGGIQLTPEGLVSEADVLKVWLEVKMKPLLSSISQQFLRCLANKNLSCEAYHTVVSEMSEHFSGMDPVRQKWIYMFFMYPFLSDNRTAGCMHLTNGSEDWLMKNFGSFSVMATMKDLTSLNMVFSGLDVLHLLTPEQRAELLLQPGVEGLDEGVLTLVFDSLLEPLLPPRPPTAGPPPTGSTSPGPHHTQHYPTTYRDPAREVADGFMAVLTPVGSFAKHFVSFTNQHNLSTVRSTTLIQAMLNWTLAELAAPYKQNNSTTPDQVDFDPLDVNDWFQHVVVPVLRRYLPGDQMEIPQNITAVFHSLFHIQTGLDPDSEETDSGSDICSVSIDESSCALTDAVEEVARVMHCAAKTKLSLTEETLMSLVMELAYSLNSLTQELAQMNFTSPDSPFFGILDNIISGPLTQDNLRDVSFIELWFQIKMRPLLPSLTPEYLYCLSGKGFSCETYQALVRALGDHMSDMPERGPEMVLENFIIPFLFNPNHTDPGCVRSAENSTDWMIKNMGRFAPLSTLMDMYQLNPEFSAVEVMPLLSPRQMAELMVVPLPRLPPKQEVVDLVFDHLLEDPIGRALPEVLEHVVELSHDMGMDCETYQIMVERLYDDLWSVPRMMEPQIWAAIHNMRQPAYCPLPVFDCPVIHFNESRMCDGFNSSELQLHLEAEYVPCEYSLMEYACSELTGFSAHNLTHLLMCKLSSNMTYSKETWKLLLTKTSDVLDEALIMFSRMASNMSHPLIGRSVANFLDVLRDMRLDRYSQEQWQDASFVASLLNGTLRPFLPAASGGFLHCLTTKNLTCETYQQILRPFVHRFHHMEEPRRRMVLESFILPYLSSNSSGHACALNDSYHWLQSNFGPFSLLVELEDLFELNMAFDPLEVLDLLSPKQMAELMVLPLPHAQGKEEVINTVLDHVLESPVERELPEVLGHTIVLATQDEAPCEFYQAIIPRLSASLRSVPRDLEPLIRGAVDELLQLSPLDCAIPLPAQCPTTPVNETRLCEGVNSTVLQSHLAAGLVPCNVSLEQYACAELPGLTAQHLTQLLVCQLSSNRTYSKETWKLLLTKTSDVLDEALIMFSHMASNMSLSLMGPSVTDVLDILGELRLELLSDTQWEDLDFISSLFGDSLRPFLPFASGELLHCVSRRNLTCETYQYIVGELSHQFDHMTEEQAEGVIKFFILPYLSRNTSDPGCISNNSMEWLVNNYGQFSGLVPLKSLLDGNKYFNPLSVLALLSPKQKAELILLPLHGLPPKQEVIRVVFNHLLQAPLQTQMPEVLQHLVTISEENEIPCLTLQSVSENLFLGLSFVPLELEHIIYTTVDQLRGNSPPGCVLPRPPSCPFTRINESEICHRSNSSGLQHLLDAGQVPCQYSVSQYACAELSGLTARHLTQLLVCQLSSDRTYSKGTWKLLLTKTSDVLDEALIMFSHMASNMSLSLMGPSVTDVLDILGELRLESLSDMQWEDLDFISSLFGDSLRPFLPFVSGDLLECVSSKNLSCETYQYIVGELSHHFDDMTEEQAEGVIRFFILPFLTRNTSDSGCFSNNSMEWLADNYGRFSSLVSLESLLDLNQDFDPLEVLDLLSPKQMAELMVLPLPLAQEKDEVINTVLDHVLESPVERSLPAVLAVTIVLAAQADLPCEFYLTIIPRLGESVASVPGFLEPIIRGAVEQLIQLSPIDCYSPVPLPTQCPTTPVNETRLCEGVNSTVLQSHLAAGLVPCNVSLEQYACAELSGFTAQHLTHLLVCKLSSNMTYSKGTWKLLLTKTSDVLDEALIMFSRMASNMSLSLMGPSVTDVLDVLGELRLEPLGDTQWEDLDFISSLFGDSLRPFLPFASGDLLHCVSRRNLTCETYQYIVGELSYQFDHMTEEQTENVVKFFILPYLSRNTSDPGCISNNSMEWLVNNYGQFSGLVPLKSLLDVNKNFDSLSVLVLLSSQQKAELILLPLGGVPPDQEVISVVFNHLLEAPVETQMPEVLHQLVIISQKNEILCLTLQLVSENLFLGLSYVPLELEHIIYTTVDQLRGNSPPGCVLPRPPSCPFTRVNETGICYRTNSSGLQHLLDEGQVPCQYSVSQYACAELSGLTAQHLTELLVCQLSSNRTYSKGTWKLLLTKTSDVLDEALIMFSHVASNMSLSLMGPSVTDVLDILGELRLESVSDTQWQDLDFISSLFGDSLRPFLPFASRDLLECVSNKNLSCETYQYIVGELSHHFDDMTEEQAEGVIRFFILPFLTRNTSDSGCFSNNSMEWLADNYGRFSALVSLESLLDLNQDFDPLEVLDLLSPKQMAGLMVLPLPLAQGKDEVIHGVLDNVLESPVEKELPEVLDQTIALATEFGAPCEFYQVITPRLREALSSVPTELEPVVRRAVEQLLRLSPRDCILPLPAECPTTPVNVSRICDGANSTVLQSHLAAGLVPCNVSLEQYACAELSGFTAQHLAQLLVCKLSSNMTYSKETWKLLLTKTSDVLDEALIMFSHMASNMSRPVFGPSVSAVLDVLGEIRLDTFSPEDWSDVDFVSTLFGDSLRPFLPFASGSLLHCVSSQDLTCKTYQHIVSEFSLHFDRMNEMQRGAVLRFFIFPFLNKTSSIGGCNNNDSVEWLVNNFGAFSSIPSLVELVEANPHFDPLAVLAVISPKQTAELMVGPPRDPADAAEVIDQVFDHLLEAPEDGRLTAVLHYLVLFSQEVLIPCPSYQAIFRRLDQASLSPALEAVVLDTTSQLRPSVPQGCQLPITASCPATLVNETRLCADINSDELMSSLSSGIIPCNVSLETFACADLSGFTAQHLTQLLICKLSSNRTYSKETWKLLLTKTSDVLDEALIMFSRMASNMSLAIGGPSATNLLDVLGEIRLDRFASDDWSDISFVTTLFGDSLRPFLPFASGDLLHCVSRKNLTCETYQHIVGEFDQQFDHIPEPRREAVLDFFIKPFLARNASACRTNDSVAWLLNNFGRFSILVPLRDLLALNDLFDPVAALAYLSPRQMAELVVLPHRNMAIHAVFDALTQPPRDAQFPEFLQHLTMLSREVMIPCDSYKTIFERLHLALSSAPGDVEPVVWAAIRNLKQTAPPECVPEIECPVTMVNETMMCMGVDSSGLQQHLEAGAGIEVLCGLDLHEFACAELSGLTAQNLTELLVCKLASNRTYSRETWKLLLTKSSAVLDEALIMFAHKASNMSLSIHGPSASAALDALREIRLDRLTPEQWQQANLTTALFADSLAPFLSFASPQLLSCVVDNLSCGTYQYMVSLFSHGFDLMDESHRERVLEDFIKVYLTNNSACLSNDSVEWLQQNLGQFSGLLSIGDLLQLNMNFRPLAALAVLSPRQIAELMVRPFPGLPGQAEVINVVFDHLTANGQKLPEVLHPLVTLSEEVMIPCEAYKALFERLYKILPYEPREVEPLIWATIDDLMQTSPIACIPVDLTCPITPFNDSGLCADIDSSALQTQLAAGVIMCNYSVEQYACAQLGGLSAAHLVSVMQCQLSKDTIQSKESWKVLLTKASAVLDEALTMLSNMSFSGPSVPLVLDVIREVRLDLLDPPELQDVAVVSAWFGQRLRPFLSSASSIFLHCVSSRNLSCATYQHVLEQFGHHFGSMEKSRAMMVLKYYIRPFLNSTGACATNNSAVWLQENLGPFSVFVPVAELVSLNPQFNPLAVVEVLSPQQTAELMVLTSPGLPDREQVINSVFDYLLAAPMQNGLPQVLQSLATLVVTVPLNCSSYQTIFKRLNGVLTSSPGALEPVIWESIYDLSATAPAACPLFMPNSQCPITPHDESVVCNGVNSTLVQQSLDMGNVDVCGFSIPELACAQWSNVSTAHLVALLQCQLSSSSAGPRGAWKLLLTKASASLDQALLVYANQTESVQGPSVAVVLDVIREVQLDRFRPEELRDGSFMSEWFMGRLRPLLSSASPGFLSCISSKNLSCSSYQHVLQAFSKQQPHMSPAQMDVVFSHFITPFLSRTSACASNNSVTWLQSNLGPFSVLANTSVLLQLNDLFKPLEALVVLSPGQVAELMVAPLPGLSDKEAVINGVFDYLATAPADNMLPEVLQSLVTLSAEPGAIPCSSYKVLFNRMDQLIPVVTVALETSITAAKTTLLTRVPSGCVIYSGECNVTPVDETTICSSINSTALQLHLDSRQGSSALCGFSIAQYACAQLSTLTAQDLVTLLTCKTSEDQPKATWKLFITKVNPILGHALDLFSSTNLTASPAVSSVLDAIGEVTFSSFSAAHVRDVAYVNRWIGTRLRPFLSSASPSFLSCLATKDFSCQTYQSVVQAMGQVYGEMLNSTLVYTDFIEVFLNKSACTAGIANSADWLEKNFGPFSAAASVVDLQRLHGSFNLIEALPRLVLRQLVEASATPGLLTSPADVTALLGVVPDQLLASYFDMLSPAAQANPIAAPLRSAMLQQVFDRANLSESSVPDAEVLVWLNDRVTFLLPDLSPSHVSPYFDIIRARQCDTSQQAVALLNATLATLGDDTQTQVYGQIMSLLTEPSPLRCYSSGSFYSFLETSFLGFQFPNLTTFLALMPASRKTELMNSIPPAQLGSFLRRPGTVDDMGKVCQLFDGYTETLQFLETEKVPEMVQPYILPCVWPRALAADSVAEVDRWFDAGLSSYLRFLNKDLVSYATVQSANCLAFGKFVTVAGTHNYTSADFTRQDVYSTIQSYLSVAPTPRCYDPAVPELASTAWFANCIGSFVTFISLEDLNAYGGASLQPFTTNLQNLQLFNQSSLPLNVTTFYVELLYLEDPTFNAIHLPLAFRCEAPALGFANLTLDQTMAISSVLYDTCSDIDQDVSSALSSNVETISPTCISMLGNSSTGFSTGQLSAASPAVLFSSLSTLSTVVGWNQGQAMTLVQQLLNSGSFTITNSNDLWSLGTLISGVPSATINSISASEIITATQSTTLVNNLMTAPTIIQQTFVSKIISVSTTSTSIITNVPNTLATQIPRNFLQDFTSTTEVATTLNQKTWTQSQSVLVFDTVANAIDNANDISFQVLQGFTCTRVRTLTKIRIKSLIRGCRRRNRIKLKLKQTQLTCMYYQIRGEADASDYSTYPADMLLYYNYTQVDNCTNYFAEMGFADYTSLSNAFEPRRTLHINNAKTCLGITGFNLSVANMNILGNMVCIMSGSYVENSDPAILEKLKNCPDLSTSLVSGMETVLLSGNTTYGIPSTWTRVTLRSLDPLPWYFTSNLWKEVQRREGRRFIKSFIKQYRRQVPRSKIKYLRRQWRQSRRAKRDTAVECTVGTITQVEINDDAFPIDYDATQFNACLSLTVLKDNLPAVTDKADEEDYHQIILQKLNQVYPGGFSDDVLQMLGPVSRGATTDDISKWNITKIDTLASLMTTSDGDWSENQTKAIMTKYLAASNSIDSSVLNSLGGSGVCFLETSTLESITSSSLQQADELTVSSCSLAKKKVLFPIAQAAFINQTRAAARATDTVTATEYQLVQSYLGGASESFVRTLVSSNVDMDIDTFLALDQSVIQTLSVTDVKSLLGDTNVNDLSTYSSDAVVQDWISRQLQTDLDTLGLGLTGGRATDTTTAATAAATTAAGSVTNAPAATTAAAAATTTTTTTTAAGGATTANTTAGAATVSPARSLYCLLLATVVSALYLLQ